MESLKQIIDPDLRKDIVTLGFIRDLAIEGAAKVLPASGPLILYGPWLKDDIETAASNLAFDADLKSRDPQWGLRRVEDFAAAAAAKGFDFVESRQMPANNLMLLFRLTENART